MQVTNSFGESNEWGPLPDSEYRIWYAIENKGNAYTTYVDYDTSTWREGLWEFATSKVSETTWNFAAAGWISAADKSAIMAANAVCLATYEAQVKMEYQEQFDAMNAETRDSGIALDVL